MLVERLESYYRDLAAKRNEQPQEWRRASSIGYCPRRLGYQKLGIKGDPLTPRRISIFHHGDAIDLALKQDLTQALGGSIITSNFRGETVIEDVTITGEADGLFHIDGRYGINDAKTMADFSFDRACNGIIDESYQVQAWIYSLIYNVDLVVFVCYRKETSHIVEVIFDKQAEGVVVTKRYGGNEKEIYTKDPLLIAEVSTPFDPNIETKAVATIKAVRETTSEGNLPTGVRAIESEVIKVQNKELKEASAKTYGPPIEVKGSWATFATGRQVAGFPCSYCPFIKRCLGAELEFDSGKPKWVVHGSQAA